jgi:putative NADH-flavin reductase
MHREEWESQQMSEPNTFNELIPSSCRNRASMKIALVGATGNVGTRLISELTRRGHHVTAIARHLEKLQGQAAVRPVSGDVQNESALAAGLAGHDVVIHSVKFLSTNASKIIAATKAAKVPRLLVVGGAGSLEVSPGLTLVNTPDFPSEYKPETLAGVKFLNVLRGEKELDWTFLSPSYFFAPGERSGKFRLGKDELLVAADGQSRISTEDFAIALVDELEQPKQSRQRFTVGY